MISGHEGTTPHGLLERAGIANEMRSQKTLTRRMVKDGENPVLHQETTQKGQAKSKKLATKLKDGRRPRNTG